MTNTHTRNGSRTLPTRLFVASSPHTFALSLALPCSHLLPDSTMASEESKSDTMVAVVASAAGSVDNFAVGTAAKPSAGEPVFFGRNLV